MKDVSITIKTTLDPDTEEHISDSTETRGKYFYSEERSYIKYTEQTSDMGEMISNIDIFPDRVEIRRHGSVKCKMTLIEKKLVPFSYDTPYGSIDMSLRAEEISADLSESGGTLMLRYDVFSADEKISTSEILFNITELQRISYGKSY